MPAPKTIDPDSLLEFGSTPIERELRTLGRLLFEGHRSPATAKFADDLGRADRYPLFFAGFLSGFYSGGAERVGAWLKECQDTLTRLRNLVLGIEVGEVAKLLSTGITTSIREFFVRPLVEVDPKGLSPATVAALEDLRLLRDLRPFFEILGFFEDQRRSAAFVDGLSSLASELVHSLALMLLQGARTQLTALLREADPQRQGEMVGALLGAGVVEIVRAIAEPEALSAPLMLAELDFDSDDVALLELPPEALAE
jgi:hypothetical protein